MAGQQFGIPPKNIANLDYTGADLALLPITEANRNPTTADKNYPIDCFWRNTVTKSLWWLSGFDSTGALWLMLQFGGAAGTIDTLTGNTGGAVGPDGSNNVNVVGDGTTITATGSPGTNTITLSLVGGGVAIDTVNVDAATAPGVTNVTADGTGAITVNGSVVAAHSVPVQTRSLALHQYDIDVQQTSAVAASDGTKSGLAHFDSAIFTANASGFVSLVGGAIPPAQSITVDAATGPGVNPVTPSATGAITVNGSVVAAHSVPVQTRSLALHQYDIDIQQAAAVAASDGTKSGLAHFDSALFNVNSSGFVTSSGSTFLTWVNQTTDLSPAVKGKAYQANKAGTACAITLPTGSTFGDTIRVQGFGATGWTLNAGVGQTIIVEGLATSVAGSVSSTNANDYIQVTCSSTTTTWFATMHGGNLTVA